MSDDWQPGDLALCLKQGAWTYGKEGPQKGNIDSVSAVTVGPDGDTYLALERWPGTEPFAYWFWSSRFRKIRPHTPDEEDRETIALLTGSPAKEPAKLVPLSSAGVKG